MKKSFNDLIKFVIDQETYVFKENNRKQVKWANLKDILK
jgi:hypothetical protein